MPLPLQENRKEKSKAHVRSEYRILSHDFRGSVALVTGSDRGLGRVIAESLLAAATAFLARSGFSGGQMLRMDGGIALLAA